MEILAVVLLKDAMELLTGPDIEQSDLARTVYSDNSITVFRTFMVFIYVCIYYKSRYTSMNN